MEDVDGGLLVSEGPHVLLAGKVKKSTIMSDEDWEFLDRKALGAIRLCLTSLVAFNISQEKTTESLMNALGKLYEKPSTSNKIFFMKKLFNMKIYENGFVVDHLNEFNMVVSIVNSVKIDFDDEVRDLLILSTLLYNWDNLVML